MSEAEEAAPVISQEVLTKQALRAREQALLQEIDQLTDSLDQQMQAYQDLIERVEDSIQFTGVHPMQQEETINRYRNVQRKLRESARRFERWKEKALPDTLSLEEKNAFLTERLAALQAIKSGMLSAQGNAYRAMQGD